MIFASVVLASVLVVSPPEQPSAKFDTTLLHQAQSAVVVSDPSLQPGFFDPTRFDSATVVSLRAIFDSAKVQGLPERPLANHALRGAQMRTSGTRIVHEVRKKFRFMIEARKALGDKATESELDTGAESLDAGADAKALQQIRSARPARGSAVTALMVMNDLINRGIQVGRARDAIVSLARVSPSDDALNGLQALVARNSDRGPGMAQDALDRYVRTNVSGAKK